MTSLEALVEWAAGSVGGVVEELRGVRGIHFAWAGLGAGAAALTSYWFLRHLLPGTAAEAMPAGAAAYHTAYGGSEGVGLVVYAERDAGSSVVRVYDAYKFTGCRAVVVVSPPLPPPVESRLAGVARVEAPGVAGMLVFSALLGLSLAEAGGADTARVRRLRGELEGLAEVAGEAAERFSALRSIREGDVLAYTPTMEPAALLAWRPGVSLVPMSSVVPLLSRGLLAGARLYLLATGVEADMVREVEFRAGLSPGVEVRRILVNTDPLTAPLYASMALLDGLGG